MSIVASDALAISNAILALRYITVCMGERL